MNFEDLLRLLQLPTVLESQEAVDIGVREGARLRNQAALTIRCHGCRRLAVGYIAYWHGRPLAITRQQGDRFIPERRTRPGWDYSWADRGPVLYVRCRVRRHLLQTADVRRSIPVGEFWVSH
jgi:hypothetical protein